MINKKIDIETRRLIKDIMFLRDDLDSRLDTYITQVIDGYDVSMNDIKETIEWVIEERGLNDSRIKSDEPIGANGISTSVDVKNRFYNQALDDFEKCLIEKCLIQQSEEGWSRIVIDTNTMKCIKEQLKL